MRAAASLPLRHPDIWSSSLHHPSRDDNIPVNYSLPVFWLCVCVFLYLLHTEYQNVCVRARAGGQACGQCCHQIMVPELRPRLTTTADVSTSVGLPRPLWPSASLSAYLCVCAHASVCECACLVRCDLLRAVTISGIILSRMAAGLHGCSWHFSTKEAINWSLTLCLSVLNHGCVCLCLFLYLFIIY